MSYLHTHRRATPRPARQHGQALIYGIFVLIAGAAALFFLFNTGQLAGEKTKLVNAADAVAYSAGVMHARALNFDAYTNRALMANEVTIAQMVSISSWLKYAQGHVNAVPALQCYSIYSVPGLYALLEYAPLCYALSWQVGALAVRTADQGFGVAGPLVMAASEASKLALRTAQTSMYVGFLSARSRLMREVADANYLNEGSVAVDAIPLTDNYTLFDGVPFITPRIGNDRARLRNTEQIAAKKDGFVDRRNWSSSSWWGCIVADRAVANRHGGTTLPGFDEWRANDSAVLKVQGWRIHFHRFRLPTWSCDTLATYGLGNGQQAANPSAGVWYYSGVPNFYEVSSKVLGYTPENSDPDKRDPRLRFAIRLTRDHGQQRTSGGTSPVKPGGQLDIFHDREARDVMAAVATSEVFFERPQARADGHKELASLFNPYWQVHLIPSSPAVLGAALALQTGATP